MSFDLSSAPLVLHQTLLGMFEPLLAWLETVPALQPLQPYLSYLPYAVLGLGLVLLLLLVRVLRRGSRKEGRKPRGGRAPRTAPKGTPIQGRAIDGMFDLSTAPFSDTSPIPQPAPTPVPPTRTEPERPVRPEGPVPPPAQTPPRAPEPAGPAEPPYRPLAQEPIVVPPTVHSGIPVPPRAAAEPVLASSPESEFQAIYIKMHIDQQLTTNFSVLRANVNERLSRGAPTEPLMPTGSGSPEENILAHTALAALDDLGAKESRLESGELSPHGQELCKIYGYALNHLRGSGRISEESANKLLRETLEKRRA